MPACHCYYSFLPWLPSHSKHVHSLHDRSVLSLFSMFSILVSLDHPFSAEARMLGKIVYYGLATWDCFRVPPDHPSYLSLDEVVRLATKVGGPRHGLRFIQLPVSAGTWVHCCGVVAQAIPRWKEIEECRLYHYRYLAV
jgi:hypothetical protein